MPDAEGLISAVTALAPLVLGIAAVRIAKRGHWVALILAAPALLLGIALALALFNDPAGAGVLGVLIYAPILVALGISAIARWYRHRPSGRRE